MLEMQILCSSANFRMLMPASFRSTVESLICSRKQCLCRNFESLEMIAVLIPSSPYEAMRRQQIDTRDHIQAFCGWCRLLGYPDMLTSSSVSPRPSMIDDLV